jgi:hypothetical protein
MAPIDDLAASLNDHQVTDEEGKVAEETAQEESAPQEQTPVEEPATAEKSADEETPPKEEPSSENEPEMVPTAEDETGKRYVPEARFKEVYAKWKEAERKQEKPFEPQPTRALQPSDKTDALETELLRTTLPQFNPESKEYSKEIDEMGYVFYEASKDAKGNHTITRLEAARKALSKAKKLTSEVAEVKSEARSVKAQQSDQGITNRVLNREGTKLDPDKMTLEEKEEWLKAQGNW